MARIVILGHTEKKKAMVTENNGKGIKRIRAVVPKETEILKMEERIEMAAMVKEGTRIRMEKFLVQIRHLKRR